MVSWFTRMRIRWWFRRLAFDQIRQYILRRRIYLVGKYCTYNEEHKRLYREYLDDLEKRLEEAMMRAERGL